MNTSEVKVEFTILSDTLLPNITNIIDVIPTLEWKVGDKVNTGKNNRVHDCSGWEISTKYEESLDMNEQLNKVVNQMKKSKALLIELLKKHELACKFCIVMKINNGNTPAIYFNHDFIEFAHELHAEIQFDTYVNPFSEED